MLGGAELTHFRAPAPLPPPACGGEQRGSGGFCQWPKPPGNLLGVAGTQTFAVLPQSATYRPHPGPHTHPRSSSRTPQLHVNPDISHYVLANITDTPELSEPQRSTSCDPPQGQTLTLRQLHLCGPQYSPRSQFFLLPNFGSPQLHPTQFAYESQPATTPNSHPNPDFTQSGAAPTRHSHLARHFFHPSSGPQADLDLGSQIHHCAQLLSLHCTPKFSSAPHLPFTAVLQPPTSTPRIHLAPPPASFFCRGVLRPLLSEEPALQRSSPPRLLLGAPLVVTPFPLPRPWLMLPSVALDPSMGGRS